MNFRTRRVETATVEITPLIDVVFILLIFFMVTSTFVSKPQLEMTLPESTVESQAHPSNALSIYVDADGFFSIEDSEPRVTTKQSILAQLEASDAVNGERLVLVHADAHSRHQAVVHVLTALAELNITKVHLVTAPPRED